ncbi:MAG TPA: hypothetical protein DD670_08735, partial [Planctomycetaceae bacterium]|nr:hypothetical protein [Planctomycetaceae bacterium]
MPEAEFPSSRWRVSWKGTIVRTCQFGNALATCLVAVVLSVPTAVLGDDVNKPLNVLFLTADDLHCESLGS